MASEPAECGKGCGNGCCQSGCAVGCSGDDTFDAAELLRRLIGYRNTLEAELASVQQAIAKIEAASEAAAGEPRS